MRRRPLIAAGPVVIAGLAGSGVPNLSSAADHRTLRVAFRSPETTFDPPQTQTDHNTVTLLAQILEAPLCYDYLARPVRLLPCTAQALPTISPDGHVFTLRIQPGIFFSDHPAFQGRPRELVAADYVYALKRFYDPRWKSADLYVFESLKLPGLSPLRDRAVRSKQPFDYDTAVEGAQAPDRYTLRITLGVADPRFVYQLANAGLLGAVAREVVDFHGDDIGAHPVGTGAFVLKRWRRASQIELVRSPTWRGARYDGTPADEPLAQQVAAELHGQPLPRVDRVLVDIVEETQPRWLTFLNGGAEWLEVPGPFRTQAAPNGELAPYLAKRGMRLQRELDATIAMSFFYMNDPLVGGTRRSRWRCGAPSGWPSTAAPTSATWWAASRCRRSPPSRPTPAATTRPTKAK